MDTIVAIATPVGRSGIGVIRVSGRDSLEIARILVRDQAFAPSPRVATLVQVHDETGSEPIDQSLLTYFRAPHSFTGEDVVEISCHGSPILLRLVVDECLRLGARMADAGEFSLRSLANGRMDLTEAEAIRDLIDAQTTAAARQAARQLRGEFSHQLQPVKDDLLAVIVVLESALEFVEDDLPQFQLDSIAAKLEQLSSALARIAGTFKAGNLVREGIRVAIVGRPNVGKSSLFNALIGSDRAIVTEIPGTTRDQLHEKFTISNIPISLIDTAGLRETTDTVERIGVERSRRTMADADLIVGMVDVSAPVVEDDLRILESVGATEHVVVLNKIDLAPARVSSVKEELGNSFSTTAPFIELSARTGAGLDELKRSIVEPFSPKDVNASGFLVSDARHYDLLVRSCGEVTSSLQLLQEKASEEIVLVGLHNALRFLGEITGETTTEDMLTEIFSTFCIGK
ncbi:MAG TPA: tRNA uridine-5-carboxymethylaminomethyl(34) synthesis GTPase MnmE [Pyrinomonadaceae bacterium]|nr:tRNA uridine-5-carboxymethylaminomethyl(34) synthesis GTPase MnmE [Pyrinomonadaceae bacterium]